MAASRLKQTWLLEHLAGLSGSRPQGHVAGSMGQHPHENMDDDADDDVGLWDVDVRPCRWREQQRGCRYLPNNSYPSYPNSPM